ncbi:MULTISPECIES: hypothetical protein [Olivibacter]|uniref:Integrase catalytic domain-containing protein n=1 Tax=Olivibacter jilunii TaxID=985016 RepID=A0ABW6B563_9SPHI|nr:hypothetical protein [Pseudosphingobacterium sp.]
MAILTWQYEFSFYLLHHSDRGIQYCCNVYTEILQRFGIAVSMTQNGSLYDNAVDQEAMAS